MKMCTFSVFNNLYSALQGNLVIVIKPAFLYSSVLSLTYISRKKNTSWGMADQGWNCCMPRTDGTWQAVGPSPWPHCVEGSFPWKRRGSVLWMERGCFSPFVGPLYRAVRREKTSWLQWLNFMTFHHKNWRRCKRSGENGVRTLLSTSSYSNHSLSLWVWTWASSVGKRKKLIALIKLWTLLQRHEKLMWLFTRMKNCLTLRDCS